MAETGRDPFMTALQAVYAALKVLDDSGRKKVLASVAALLEIETPSSQPTVTPPAVLEKHPTSARPVSLVELINEKKPGTSAQRIALFAYYREKVEGLARFGRDDLERYFATAKQPPAGNYGRDFVEAVRKGWIHEDKTDSYLTTKGIEAIETSFEGERKVKRRNTKSKTKGLIRSNLKRKRRS